MRNLSSGNYSFLLIPNNFRFADYIVKRVSEEKHDVFLDGVGWEGGDEWIRTQFRIYLLCLLRTSMLQGIVKYIHCKCSSIFS